MGNPRKPKPAAAEPVLAYQDNRFMQSGEGRVLRILAEYLEPQARLRRARVQNTVVFFGSARLLSREEADRKLGELQGRSEEDGGSPAGGPDFEAALMTVEMSRYYEEARELAKLITRWSLSLGRGKHFLVVCSGGGPGIMEAANRGATEAGGPSLGPDITLPSEPKPNPYVNPGFKFVFKDFFMRKLWFAGPPRAPLGFPRG